MKADIDQRVSDIGFSRPQHGPAFASNADTNENDVSVSVAGQGNVSQYKAVSESRLAQSVAEKPSVTVEELNQAADTIEEFLGRNQRNLSFERNLDSGKMVISVIDGESQDVIRKIPSEEAIQIASKIEGLRDELIPSSGVIFERQV
jgi:flagellar protein FlaG